MTIIAGLASVVVHVRRSSGNGKRYAGKISLEFKREWGQYIK